MLLIHSWGETRKLEEDMHKFSLQVLFSVLPFFKKCVWSGEASTSSRLATTVETDNMFIKQSGGYEFTSPLLYLTDLWKS